MARCPFANWQGSPNDYPDGMDAQPLGVVLHIEQGYEAGTVSVFHNPGAQASAHFGVAKSGAIDQFVDTKDAAWAEVAGNRHWISIEHEGFAGEQLTPAQIASDARLIAWLHGREGGPGYTFALRTTDSVTEGGLGWHGMGGADWGGHTGCPGDPIKAQRPTILADALALLGGRAIVVTAGPVPASPPPAPNNVPLWPGRMLRQPPETIGADVRTWQGQMARRGWTIAVDGQYGPKSESICRQFQAEKNLGVDGVVGPVTWRAAWVLQIT